MLNGFAPPRLRSLAVTLGLLACWPAAWGQQAGAAKEQTLPAGTVLAINLISADEVRPTTGVLVSADGLVVVPLAFAAEGAELVVLDGGGNVLRHGRRATVLHRIAASGLAILQVEGLRGTPLELAEPAGADGERLRFGAFPPAEQMAAGVGPMWLGVTLVANPEADIYGLEGEQPIPNVSGPLFNRCQHWVGYSLATGEPALKSEFGPIVLFSPELRRALASAGVPVQTGYCPPLPVSETAATDQPAAAEPTATAAANELNQPDEQAEPVQETIPETSERTADDSTDEPQEQPAALSADDTLKPPPASADAAGRERLAPGWWLLSLALLAAGGWWWLRRRTASASKDAVQVISDSQPRHAADPGAQLLEAVPDRAQLPPGCTGWWHLSGESRGGHPIRLYLPFGGGQPTALVVCEKEGLRLCVELAGDKDAETAPAADQPLAALGLELAVNGLVITALDGRVPCQVAGVSCLPGEKMYANPDDAIMVDGHRFSIRILEPESV